MNILPIQTPASRALNVGYIRVLNKKREFIPCRLNLGAVREQHTYQATIDSFRIPKVERILKKYDPEHISTITVLRETLACRLASALEQVGIRKHYGDAFIGATHIKGNGTIRTSYLYENTEGLHPKGLWIIADSICIGRNLGKTMDSLLLKFKPRELLFICPIASRRGVKLISSIISKKNISTTFVVWGGLFGVNEKNLYDMPWGHKDTEPVDRRDQEVFINMYGNKLCVGGDFGNNYYCPPLAKKLYFEQLKKLKIKPKIPTADQILQIYNRSELFGDYLGTVLRLLDKTVQK